MVSSEDIIRILCEWELKNNQIDALPSKLCLLAAAISILLMGILALLVILLFMLRGQKDQFEKQLKDQFEKQLKEVKSLLPEKKQNNESNLEFLNIMPNDHRNSPEELHQYQDESGSANAPKAEPDLTAEAMKLWSGETSKVEWKYAAYGNNTDVYVKAKNNSEAYRNYPLIPQNSADEAFFMYAFDQESGKLFPKKAERMYSFWTEVQREHIGLIFELEVDGKTVWSARDPDTDDIFNQLNNTKPSRFEPAIVKKADDRLAVVRKGKIIV